MNTVTLKGSDFSRIHNTLCKLRDLRDDWDEIPRLTVLLDKIISQFESGLQNCYEQDRALTSEKIDHYSHYKNEHSLVSIWSVYEVDDLEAIHPYTHNEYLHYKNDIEYINGSSWLDLYLAADRLIVRSRDLHHVFIEGFYLNEDESLNLSTGS